MPGLHWDIILGMDWLESFDHTKIDWSSRSMYATLGNVTYKLTHDIPPIKLHMSSKQAMKEVRRNKKAFLCIVDATHVIPSEGQDVEISRLQKQFPNVFRKDLFDSVPSREFKHTISLEPGSKPVGRPAYRFSPQERKTLEETLRDLLTKGLIRPSKSPYGAPVLFAPKPDGSLRFCVDYRLLNKQTIKDRFPLPRIDALLDAMQGATCFSTLDLLSGYWQVEIEAGDMYKTGFNTPYGHYEWIALPMGLCNAPATFMRIMNTIFADVIEKYVVVYLDDIMVFSKTPEEHAMHLEEVLRRLDENKFIIKESKCKFYKEEVEFLGFLVNSQGLRPSPKKIECIRSWRSPTNIAGVRSFLGLASFYRRFIKGFSLIALPLTELTKKDVPFHWGDAEQHAFDLLKAALVLDHLLILPDPTKPYVVTTDAS